MKNLIISAALAISALTCTANEPVVEPDYIVMNFNSEMVVDRMDESDGENERYLFVYCTQLNDLTNECEEYEELLCDRSIYNEWVDATLNGQLFSVNIIWSKEDGCYKIDQPLMGKTYKTWEPDGDFRWPEF